MEREGEEKALEKTWLRRGLEAKYVTCEVYLDFIFFYLFSVFSFSFESWDDMYIRCGYWKATCLFFGFLLFIFEFSSSFLLFVHFGCLRRCLFSWLIVCSVFSSLAWFGFVLYWVICKCSCKILFSNPFWLNFKLLMMVNFVTRGQVSYNKLWSCLYAWEYW